MENIAVAVRIRPQNQREADAGEISIWSTTGKDSILVKEEKYNELLNQRKIIPGQKTDFTYS